jgi:hypothetical protein
MMHREWVGEGFTCPASWPKRIGSVCPGYLVRLPAVCETALWHAWYAKSQLELKLGKREMSGMLEDCINVLQGAVADVEADMMVPK